MQPIKKAAPSNAPEQPNPKVEIIPDADPIASYRKTRDRGGVVRRKQRAWSRSRHNYRSHRAVDNEFLNKRPYRLRDGRRTLSIGMTVACLYYMRPNLVRSQVGPLVPHQRRQYSQRKVDRAANRMTTHPLLITANFTSCASHHVFMRLYSACINRC